MVFENAFPGSLDFWRGGWYTVSKDFWGGPGFPPARGSSMLGLICFLDSHVLDPAQLVAVFDIPVTALT